MRPTRPPRRLNRAIPAELETIVLKAMAKNPAERYGTARELADDLKRFLEDKPIRARRPTLVQRLRKWARRHKPVVTTLAAAAVALLVVVAIGAIVAALRIEDARGKAEQAKQNEGQERKRAEAQAEESRRRAVALSLVQGRRELDDGDLPGALLWYVEALRLDQGDPAREEPHRIRIGAILRQYPRLVHAWFHTEPVSHAEFSPDGRYLATSGHWFTSHEGRKGASRVWDTSTGELVWTLEHDRQVDSATFSPDGRRLATAGKDKVAQVWDMATGRRVPRLEHKEQVLNAVFSPDGGYLAAATRAEVSLRDAATGEEVRSFKPGGVARFSPDGRRLVAASYTQTPHMWDVATGELLKTLKQINSVYHAEFSTDGRRLVVASFTFTPGMYHMVYLWDEASGSVKSLRHDSRVDHAAFSPDGRHLVTASYDHVAQVWDAATGERLLPPMKHGSGLFHAAFSPDGRRIATACRDGTAWLWMRPPASRSVHP